MSNIFLYNITITLENSVYKLTINNIKNNSHLNLEFNTILSTLLSLSDYGFLKLIGYKNKSVVDNIIQTQDISPIFTIFKNQKRVDISFKNPNNEILV